MGQNVSLDKRLLIHQVGWSKNSFNHEDAPVTLSNVRMHSTTMFYEQSNMQTAWGNWVLLWDHKYSTPLPEGTNFAIGDSITWNQYPKVLKVTYIEPVYALDGTEVSHFKLILA